MAESRGMCQGAQKKGFKPTVFEHLGKELYLFESVWDNIHYVNLREVIFRNGQSYPTKRGISLTLSRFKELMDNYDMIRETILQYDQQEVSLNIHLGGNWFVSIHHGFPVVNIRKFCLPDNASHVVPTKKGIVLTFGQFECLRNASGIMERNVLELNCFIQCHKMEYHNADYCLECNPNIQKTEAQRYYDARVKMGLKAFC